MHIIERGEKTLGWTLLMMSESGVRENGVSPQKRFKALMDKISLGFVGSTERAFTTRGGGTTLTRPKTHMLPSLRRFRIVLVMKSENSSQIGAF